MAKKSANSVISAGKMSPRAIDFGFRKCLIRAATSCLDSIAIGDENVDGISEGSRGRNYLEIALKCSTKTFATSKSVMPRTRSEGRTALDGPLTGKFCSFSRMPYSVLCQQANLLAFLILLLAFRQ